MIEFNCKFCNSSPTPFGKYFVCENCKTVVFTKGYENKEIIALIKNYIKNINNQRLYQAVFLHKLEQKYTSGKELTAEENEIRNNMTEFADIYLELKELMDCDNAFSAILSNKIVRMPLYRLLKISDWLDNYFCK